MASGGVGGRSLSSAQVGEDDRLDGHAAHGAQLVPFLKLAGAQVAGDHVARAAVHDAAVLGPRLADETRVEARLGQPPLGRHAALQLRGGDEGQGRAVQREQLLGVRAGGGGLRLRARGLRRGEQELLGGGVGDGGVGGARGGRV